VHVAFVELNLKGDLQEEDGGRGGQWPRRGARVGRVILASSFLDLGEDEWKTSLWNS
jgi:hypothetical protein